MKVFSLKEAEASRDIDIKMMATRSSRYRVFGTSERIGRTAGVRGSVYGA
jgi:hypothetical protein